MTRAGAFVSSSERDGFEQSNRLGAERTNSFLNYKAARNSRDTRTNLTERDVRTTRQIGNSTHTPGCAKLTFLLIGIFFLIPIASPIAFCQQAAIPIPTPTITPTPAPTPTAAPDGKEIFDERCSTCHGMNGGGVAAAVNILGPSLKAEHNEKWVLHRIRNGKGKMPTFSRILTPQQIQAVADYVTQNLAVIPLGGGKVSEGTKMFSAYCAPCHRTAVRGGALAFAGTNAPNLTDKSPAVVASTVRWGPGPMPSFPPSVISNQQLASIVKYVHSVQHPPSPGGFSVNFRGPVVEGFIGWIGVFGIIGFAVLVEKGGKG